MMHCKINLYHIAKHHPCATPRYRGSGKPFLGIKSLPHHLKKHHFTNKSVRELIQQIFPSNMDQNPGKHIIQVCGRPLFGYPGHSGSHSFPELMVENNYILLLQFLLRGWHVILDRLIVTEHVVCYLYRDTKHTKLVPKDFGQFGRYLESDKPARECSSIYSVLLFTIP